MSRPVEADRARARLNARAMLAKAVPAVETLRAELRDKPLDPDRTRLLVEQALMQIETAAQGQSAVATAVEVRGGDAVASAVGAYDDAVKQEAAISALAAGIARLHDDSRIAQRAALLDVAVASAKDAVRPAYVDAFVDQLHEAGFTSAIRRGLSREQMDDIREILGKPKKERKPAGSRQKSARFDIPPPTQSLWTALMDPIPGYTFKRRPADRGNPEEAAIVAAGLPPMTTLDGYKPGAAVELARIATNREKAKFTWDTVATWLTVHAPADDATRFARRLAWTFLLGHVHGFLADVKGLDDVGFASPWQANQIIIASRTG
jgi:hypothetical protein